MGEEDLRDSQQYADATVRSCHCLADLFRRLLLLLLLLLRLLLAPKSESL